MPCNKKKKKKYKRGQMQLSSAAAVGLIIMLIMGGAIGTLMLIFTGALGGQTYNMVEGDIDGIGNQTSTGDRLDAMVNGTAYNLSHSDIHDGSITVFDETNTSGVVFAGNFSLSNDKVTMVNSLYNGANVSFNYTWGDQEIKVSVKAGIKSGFTALEQTGKYLPIVVLAVVISIVIFLMLGFGGAATYRGGAVL